MGEAVLFPRMGTIKEAADASGLAVYRVRRLVASGRIRYVKAGRRILVNLDSLARYLNTGDQPDSVTCGGMQRIPE
ncbi:MAG TPA: helix-turn-helix domain-containing protein [Candidatus Gemmiger excrementigallinarum]|uniref:Helix-turn-helix domain-containing protein n=1 Tax=Candidatus Gemmiger excrementigallinarum TaxID=2838609 RepID=A0A9D2EPQ0_9FIRM|nr:helix-turn-helix domain-containing protein [Candidatus Gemmiger excrementigallinarum]